MGKSSKKRPYTAEDDHNSENKKTRDGVEEEDEEEEEADDVMGASESDSEQNCREEKSEHGETAPKANKKKKGKTNGEDSKQSDKSLAQSEDEGMSNVAKRSKNVSSKKNKSKTKIKSGKADKQGNDEKLEVEAIVTYTVGDFKRKYCVKLKNDSKMWISAQKLTALYPDMLRNYSEDLKNGTLVEAITSHKYDKNTKRKYLIKWKDHSKGLTWESPKTASMYCSKMLQAYNEELEQAEAKTIEVEKIVSHKIVCGESKYLIKWKDECKGETWETARRTITVCPDILDKFTEKNPDCVPRLYEIGSQYKSRAVLPKTVRKQKADAEEFEEWEVKQILDVNIKKNHKSREFLIRWKGYGSEYDSWEPEKHLNSKKLIEEYMAERKNSKNKLPQTLRPLQKQTDHLVDRITIKKKSLGTRLSKRRNGKQM